MTTRVSLHTLGCRLNHSESENLGQQLSQQGYQIVPEDAEADLCIVNTCTVTGASDSKNRQLIRSLHRRMPQAQIAVTGCQAQMEPEAMADLPGVGLVVGNEAKHQIANWLPLLDEAQEFPKIVHNKIRRLPFSLPLPLAEEGKAERPLGPTRGQLKVQDGCDFMCSFCIIPFARGRSRHREFDNLCTEAEQQVASGIQEIVLTGVNLGTYDIHGRSLVDIVDFLDSLTDLQRIRISSIEPTTVDPNLLERMRDQSHKLVPFLHLPVQSGSNRILELMKRRYSALDYAREVEEAVQKIPDLCVGTDVMVGFPGEGESEFKETLNLLANLPMSYLHVFPFSERAGTPATRLSAKVSPEDKRARAAQLRELSKRLRHRFMQRFIGTSRGVLLERTKPDGRQGGYTDNYLRVQLNSTKHKGIHSNRLIPVQLESIRGDVLMGTPLASVETPAH
ncbi:MAG: tRNA (N(6)-L-threonylcarbamoyladenosine(37)-C(2))-methylthiotransferase MtaB [Deltaproteobacteria bacterium]|nr:tRNA (N(6)-L-threonylcarbamoyladenosine(37)-C(2))-methylthiotransferase MtaB [Deltaproteobacteria bacterium]